MSYNINKNAMYMMPVHFGPCVTPRQNKDGERFIYEQPIHTVSHMVVYEGDLNQLNTLVPQGFEVTSPYVSVFMNMLTDIAWLAGHGYNLAGVTVPVRYKGKKETIEGNLLLVMWENHADPIITGREQLGFSKIFAEIDNATIYGNHVQTKLSSWGFRFLEMNFEMSKEPENIEELKSIISNPNSKGTLHYKYVPQTGNGFTEAGIEYVTLTPNSSPMPQDVKKYEPAKISFMQGNLKWNIPKWEDMPTQYHIIQALGGLKIKRYVGAIKTDGLSVNDYYNQMIVE